MVYLGELIRGNATHTDLLGQSEPATLYYERDLQAPEIALDNPIAPLPAENTVLETPYRVTGQVVEPNFTSLTLNGEPLTVTPGPTTGVYRFSFAAGVAAAQANVLRLQAFDFAGNITGRNVKGQGEIGRAKALPETILCHGPGAN